MKLKPQTIKPCPKCGNRPRAKVEKGVPCCMVGIGEPDYPRWVYMTGWQPGRGSVQCGKCHFELTHWTNLPMGLKKIRATIKVWNKEAVLMNAKKNQEK